MLSLALGMVFLALAIAARAGVWKSWYWTRRNSACGYGPLSLVFLLYAIESLVKTRVGPTGFNVLAGLLVAVWLWWTIRPPALAKPAWVRWVEHHPAGVQAVMAQAARAGALWKEQVRTEAAVDRWARTLKSADGGGAIVSPNARAPQKGTR
jgi:hypothetical protein